MDEFSSKQRFRETFHVSRETMDRLQVYHDLLVRWQRIKNLVSKNTLATIWDRHFADSAQVLDIGPKGATWLDMGSGAGFPGLVIAVLGFEANTVKNVVLIDSDHRKCAFLREVARETGVNAEVRYGRIEDIVGDVSDIDVVTARALAPLENLVDYAWPLLSDGALGLFFKGQDVEYELRGISKYSKMNIELVNSKTDAAAKIVKVSTG